MRDLGGYWGRDSVQYRTDAVTGVRCRPGGVSLTVLYTWRTTARKLVINVRLPQFYNLVQKLVSSGRQLL